jgi:hypothetical protein
VSRILRANLRRSSSDAERLYGHRVRLAETFVEGSRFARTCLLSLSRTPNRAATIALAILSKALDRQLRSRRNSPNGWD